MLQKMNNKNKFRIITIGWGASLIENMLDNVQRQSEIEFSHIVINDLTTASFKNEDPRSDIFEIRKVRSKDLPSPDQNLLASLEGEGIPTIHNMILGDRIIRTLHRSVALSYATLLAKRIKEVLEAERPDAVLGGFDSIYAGIGLAVCRNLNIPWVAMTFTTIPSGYTAFCNSISPNAILPVHDQPEEVFLDVASRELEQFESGLLATPAYVAPYSMSWALKRMLLDTAGILKRTLQKKRTPYGNSLSNGVFATIINSFSKRRNMIYVLTRKSFLRRPPNEKFAFFAIHMQPESSTDAWAPFFADQLHLIKQIVRAMPPNLKLLVKLHFSAPDMYTPRQLREIARLPGLEIVEPNAPSRDFVKNAALIVSIQGTISMEAALLGKPVLMFGDSPYLGFPSVELAGRFTELPEQIRNMLNKSRPSRQEIIHAFARYLSRYMPGTYNDWSKNLKNDDLEKYTFCFNKLKEYLSDAKPVIV